MIVTVAVAVSSNDLAVTVYVADLVSVGVPEMTPVLALNESPVGRPDEMVYPRSCGAAKLRAV